MFQLGEMFSVHNLSELAGSVVDAACEVVDIDALTDGLQVGILQNGKYNFR